MLYLIVTHLKQLKNTKENDFTQSSIVCYENYAEHPVLIYLSMKVSDMKPCICISLYHNIIYNVLFSNITDTSIFQTRIKTVNNK